MCAVMLFLKEHDCTFPPKTTHLPRRAGGVKEDNTPPPKSGGCKGRQHTSPEERGGKEDNTRPPKERGERERLQGRGAPR